MAAWRRSSTAALVIKSRLVWLRISGMSLPRAMILILPSSSAWMPNGGVAQPTSIWPDITCVKVGGGPPVATGLAAARPYSLMMASTIAWVDEPTVEYAMVAPLASLMVLIGDAAGTYQ